MIDDITVKYSNRNLEPVLVSLRGRERDAGNSVGVKVEFNAFLQGRNIIEFYFRGAGHASRSLTIANSLMSEATRLARWMVLNGSYTSFTNMESPTLQRLEFSHLKSDKTDFTYSEDENSLRLDYPPLITLPIEESKLARRLIVHYLYHNGSQMAAGVAPKIHFPHDIVSREVESLIDSEFVRISRLML